MNKEQIYEEAFTRWSVESQITQLMEECAELIQASCKVTNRTHTEETWPNFFEEVADVIVMVGQMQYRYGEIIQEIVEKKLKRLEKKLFDELGNPTRQRYCWECELHDTFDCKQIHTYHVSRMGNGQEVLKEWGCFIPKKESSYALSKEEVNHLIKCIEDN